MKEFYVQWHITDRCNLRCIDCYQDNYTAQGELSFPELSRVVENFSETMAKWNSKLKVSLTGGEPLLKKETWDLLSVFEHADFVSETGIITNGTVVGDYTSEIKQYDKLKDIYISLDGSTPAVNDKIRGDGTYKRTISNLQKLIEEEIPVTIMFTLMKENLNDTPSMIELARTLNVNGLIIERFIPLGSGKKIKDSVINGEELSDLYGAICNKIGIEYEPAQMAKYRAVQIEFSKDGSTPLLYGAECVVAQDGMALLPDATILPCRRFNLPVGNMLREKLHQVFETSEVLCKIRERQNIAGRCGTCKMNGCRGCRAMVYALTGDYLAQDPHCWIDKAGLRVKG
ncbi:MAG: radical SAM protein [Elusimicrobiota bacterium]